MCVAAAKGQGKGTKRGAPRRLRVSKAGRARCGGVARPAELPDCAVRRAGRRGDIATHQPALLRSIPPAPPDVHARAHKRTHKQTRAIAHARTNTMPRARTHTHTNTHTHTQNTRTHATRTRAGAFTSGKGRGRGAGAGWLAGSLTVSGWGRWCGAGFESWRWRTWKACLTACTAWRCSATPPRTRLALARARSRARGHTHKHARTASSIRH